MQVTCSRGGTCVAAPTTSTAPSAGPGNTAASAAAQAAAVDAPNKPPEIMLNPVLGVSSVVRVRRGQTYTVCPEGVPPTAGAPCEPGATASDPDGIQAADAFNGSTALNLTSRVVVCPPAKCISSGCSPAELQRHFLTAKGLKGCGIDADAAEGTQFKVCSTGVCHGHLAVEYGTSAVAEHGSITSNAWLAIQHCCKEPHACGFACCVLSQVDFWVWDSGRPVLNATVSRIVLVDPPCPDPSTPYLCFDSYAGRSLCSGVWPAGPASALLSARACSFTCMFLFCKK
jgi:hypothetical protein